MNVLSFSITQTLVFIFNFITRSYILKLKNRKKCYLVAVARNIALGSKICGVLHASSNHALNCPIGSLLVKLSSVKVSFLSLYFIRISVGKVIRKLEIVGHR